MTEAPRSTSSANEAVKINSAFVGVGAALGLVLWFFLFPLPLSVASGLISLSHPRLGSFLGFLGMLLMVPGVLFVARTAWGREWRRAIPLAKVNPAILVWTILCVIAFFPVEFAWFAAVERIFGPPILADPKASLGAMWVLGLMIAAPLAEEVLFRGYGLARIRELGGERRALLFTTIVFALLHGHWAKMPGTLFTGLFLGWLVLRTGSLWPAFLGHFTTNLIPVLLGWFGLLSQSDHQLSVAWTLAIGTAGLTCFALLWALQVHRRLVPA